MQAAGRRRRPRSDAIGCGRLPPSATISGTGVDVVVSVDGAALRVGDRFGAGTRGDGGGSALEEFGDLATTAPESGRGHRAIQLQDFDRAS